MKCSRQTIYMYCRTSTRSWLLDGLCGQLSISIRSMVVTILQMVSFPICLYLLCSPLKKAPDQIQTSGLLGRELNELQNSRSVVPCCRFVWVFSLTPFPCDTSWFKCTCRRSVRKRRSAERSGQVPARSPNFFLKPTAACCRLHPSRSSTGKARRRNRFSAAGSRRVPWDAEGDRSPRHRQSVGRPAGYDLLPSGSSSSRAEHPLRRRNRLCGRLPIPSRQSQVRS